MKKPLITGVFAAATLGAVSAQGLYDIAPNDEASESLPLKWSAGIDLIYDDNIAPTSGEDEESLALSAHVGASLVHVTPQTTWDVFVRLGIAVYLDSPDANVDDVFSQSRLGFNWAHRVSERLRFTSRNFIAYEQEPDVTVGLLTDRQLGETFQYSSDNAVGYRWTERFGTFTGFAFRGVLFDNDFDANDRNTFALYHQFRYRATEQTVWTLDYRYSLTSSDGSASDSDNQFITLGIEHRFSPNSVLALKGGVQIRDVDNGEDSTNPFIEAAVRTRVNEQLSFRAFARYSVEDFGTSFAGFTYDTNDTLRLGLNANYVLSPVLTLHGGVNFISTDFQDGRDTSGLFPGGIDDLDQDLVSLFLGFSYKINDGVFLTGSYNYSNSDASGGEGDDDSLRSYSRNSFSLGARFEF